MNCSSAQRLLSAERDGAPASPERAGLAAHVAGCAECRGTGYRGRMPLVELLPVDDALRAELRAGRLGSPAAAPTLAETGAWMVAEGRTTRAELERVLGT